MLAGFAGSGRAAFPNQYNGSMRMRLPSIAPRTIIVVTGACALIAAVIIGVAAYRVSPARHINRALDFIESSDPQITRVDEALNTPLSTETTTQVKATQRAIVTARRSLASARRELDAISANKARGKKTAARLAKTRAALTARDALLACASPLLSATARYSDALASAARGWQSLQDAAALTDAAQTEFAQQTQDALVSSHSASTQAASAYLNARQQFAAAARAAPEADFSAYLDYLQQRVLMTQSALLACEDWINGHYQDANADVTAYNGFARAAARVAGDGLRLPSDLLASAWTQQTKTLQQTYDHARAEVLRADGALR